MDLTPNRGLVRGILHMTFVLFLEITRSYKIWYAILSNKDLLDDMLVFCPIQTMTNMRSLWQFQTMINFHPYLAIITTLTSLIV